MSKKVIISGVTGQDGSYMTDYLLAHTDHKIYGIVRHTSSVNTKNLTEALKNPRFEIVKADLTDLVSLSYLVDKIKPDYFINFAAQSFVAESWNSPVNTFEINALGILYCLEAVRKYAPCCRVYSAGTSEEVGDVDYCPQDLAHPLKPRSPYGASKAAAKHLVKVYRESYNMYAIHGRLYNHESERRGEMFVTRKITKGVARIAKHLSQNKFKDMWKPIELGNIDAKRDWSHALDFCDGIWKMLNLNEPKEYVLSSGEAHSVREFIEIAFRVAGYEGVWAFNKDLNPLSEAYVLCMGGDPVVTINPKFYRPAEVELLLGNSNPIREELGWKPSINFEELVRRMVTHDINECRAS